MLKIMLVIGSVHQIEHRKHKQSTSTLPNSMDHTNMGTPTLTHPPSPEVTHFEQFWHSIPVSHPAAFP